MEVNTEMNLLNLISLWFDDITLHLVFQIGIQPFPWRKIKHAFHLATHPHCCLWQELVTKLCQLPRSLMITDRSGQVAIGNCVHVKSWRLQAGAGFYCWVRSSDWPAEAGPGTTLTDPDWSYRTKQKGRPFSKQACTASALYRWPFSTRPMGQPIARFFGPTRARAQHDFFGPGPARARRLAGLGFILSP
jgi:hypothetical protein